MEVLLTATMGELVSRCMSFLIDRYCKPPSPSRQECLQRLERMLLRLAVTVEEAEARRITNQAMLRQLSVLRGEMCRGYHLLDTCRYLAHGEGEAKVPDQLSRPFALIPGKHVSFSALMAKDIVKQMLGSMETLISDMDEFVIFLKNHPPICRQPYSMHLVLENCMFGRQAEMERIISFLLQREPPGEHTLGVLSIVGQEKVGKSTLVEHACCDIRVRDHFSQILFFRADQFREENLHTLRDGGILKFQNSALNGERMLFIIELDGDIDEVAWRRMYSASQGCIPRGSKIIITSRSENITKIGTTEALRLNFLPRDASWYFFKVLLFGSTNPEEQPKLASIAMQIFEEYFDQDQFKGLIGVFANSKGVAEFLRADANIQHWRRALTCVRGIRQRNLLEFSTGPCDTRTENNNFYLQRTARLTQDCVVHRHARIGLAHEEIPKITLRDVFLGSVTPQGRFEAVAWKSHLPPYYCYITSCEIRKSKFAARSKHGKKRKGQC